MSGVLFVLAIFAAMVALGVKRMKRTRAERMDGYLEEDEEPRVIASHADIAGFLRCACGGTRVETGEGPKGELWRVVTRCASCGNRRALLFRLAS